jgi:hypothetical protein
MKVKGGQKRPYQDAHYKTIRATKGSFTGQSEFGITDTSKSLVQNVFEKQQTVPQE